MERSASLLRSLLAALFSLFHKLRRAGLVELAKAVQAIFSEETLFEAMAGHREVLALFERPPAKVLRARPHLPNKYLSAYMAKSFGKKARREILLHHYRYLAAHAPQDFHARTFRDPYTLWRLDVGQKTFAITLVFNKPYHYEGDLSLVFMADKTPIFEISFAVAPGVVVGAPYKEVILIGRVQGHKYQFDAIREATRACQDIAPAHLLMTAVQALAQVMGIFRIVGVSNDDQVANVTLNDPHFTFNYDNFWETLLAVRTPAGFYEMPVPLVQKSLRDVQISHRRRARRKRLFKEDVGEAISQALTAILKQGHRLECVQGAGREWVGVAPARKVQAAR